VLKVGHAVSIHLFFSKGRVSFRSVEAKEKVYVSVGHTDPEQRLAFVILLRCSEVVVIESPAEIRL